MLLLINRRYPALGAVLGIIAALAFLAIGVATSHSMLVVMGVVSIVLSIARTTKRRSDISEATR
jgi:uncharacterized membrane protein